MNIVTIVPYHLYVLQVFIGLLCLHASKVWVGETNRTGKAGEEMTLFCDYDGEVRDVYWMKKRSEGEDLIAHKKNPPQVEEQSGVTKYVIVDRASLKIQSLDYPEDQGQFACRAGNTALVNVTVTAPMRKTWIEHNAFPAMAGRKHTLTCLSIGGNPPPKFKWFLDDQRITKSIMKINHNTSKITIETERSMHRKWLRCEADNTAGRATSRTRLNITYKPKIGIIETNSPAVEGGNLQLRCVVDSNPNATIAWRFELSDGRKQFGMGYKHTISRVDQSRAGLYTCEARNNVGHDSKSVMVHILSHRRELLGVPQLILLLLAILAVFLTSLAFGLVCRRHVKRYCKCRNRSNDRLHESMELDHFVVPQDIEGRYTELVFEEKSDESREIRRQTPATDMPPLTSLQLPNYSK